MHFFQICMTCISLFIFNFMSWLLSQFTIAQKILCVCAHCLVFHSWDKLMRKITSFFLLFEQDASSLKCKANLEIDKWSKQKQWHLEYSMTCLHSVEGERRRERINKTKSHQNKFIPSKYLWYKIWCAVLFNRSKNFKTTKKIIFVDIYCCFDCQRGKSALWNL